MFRLQRRFFIHSGIWFSKISKSPQSWAPEFHRYDSSVTQQISRHDLFQQLDTDDWLTESFHSFSRNSILWKSTDSTVNSFTENWSPLFNWLQHLSKSENIKHYIFRTKLEKASEYKLSVLMRTYFFTTWRTWFYHKIFHAGSSSRILCVFLSFFLSFFICEDASFEWIPWTLFRTLDLQFHRKILHSCTYYYKPRTCCFARSLFVYLANVWFRY